MLFVYFVFVFEAKTRLLVAEKNSEAGSLL